MNNFSCILHVLQKKIIIRNPFLLKSIFTNGFGKVYFSEGLFGLVSFDQIQEMTR